MKPSMKLDTSALPDSTLVREHDFKGAPVSDFSEMYTYVPVFFFFVGTVQTSTR